VRGSAQSVRFDPIQSDSIRPNPTPGESDRMKPVVECKCAMAGAARWIATSGRDGCGLGEDARLKSGVKTCFCETNPNREKRGSAATGCKRVGYLETIQKMLTVLEAKRSQMWRFNPKAEVAETVCSVRLAKICDRWGETPYFESSTRPRRRLDGVSPHRLWLRLRG
jgi:hypothetical protein